mmetsp:Transcript_15379/g.46868  ORF Transcript_15379/g.46868 Transcript_15379/m.46868 type:complete len:92 (-) Transcript_15379:879-1154(-)
MSWRMHRKLRVRPVATPGATWIRQAWDVVSLSPRECQSTGPPDSSSRIRPKLMAKTSLFAWCHAMPTTTSIVPEEDSEAATEASTAAVPEY